MNERLVEEKIGGKDTITEEETTMTLETGGHIIEEVGSYGELPHVSTAGFQTSAGLAQEEHIRKIFDNILNPDGLDLEVMPLDKGINLQCLMPRLVPTTDAHIGSIKDSIERDHPLPPPVIYRGDKIEFRVAGENRMNATLAAGFTDMLVEVITDKHQAYLRAAKENSSHGIGRGSGEVKRNIKMLVEARIIDLATISANDVAGIVNCSRKHATKILKEIKEGNHESDVQGETSTARLCDITSNGPRDPQTIDCSDKPDKDASTTGRQVEIEVN
jgi:hypothetical protein